MWYNYGRWYHLSKVPYVYYLYHKPVGVICTNNLNIKNNIINQVNLPYRVFCVGRLDKESSGLIILTNDGAFSNYLANSYENVEKEYIVTLEKPIDQKLLESLKTPITIRNKITKETIVKIINDNSFQIILTDGKYHQIRRLVIRGGNTVKTLKRIRIGKYMLNELKENEILKFNGGNYEKFKIVLMLGVMLIMVSTLSSCASKPKEFSSNGITVTLTNKFKYGNDENAQVLLLTSKIGFMGNGEYKTSVGVSDNQLEHYTQKVLNVSGKTADIMNYDEDGVTFCYAYYTATAQNITFKYMLITKEGTSKYYTMNFWSKESEFDEYKDQFLEWAKTIKVE